jgi:hypothetical protein
MEHQAVVDKQATDRAVANSMSGDNVMSAVALPSWKDNRPEAVLQRRLKGLFSHNLSVTHPRNVLQRNKIIQLGGGPKPLDVGLSDAEKITEHGGFSIYYGKKGSEYYVDALIKEEDKTVEAAYVQIVVSGKSIALHTNAHEKYRGGIGTAILPIAIYVIGRKHVREDSVVTLPMGGAAVIKLLTEKLSQILGTPDIHKEAEKLKTARKSSGKKGSMDVDKLSEDVSEEHKLHMQSLMNSDKGSQLTFTSYGRQVVEDNPTEVQFGLDAYIKKVTTDPSQLFVDIPGNLFLEFAASFR